MSDLLRQSFWTNAREKVVAEFQHAPLGSIGAVVAMLDVAWRLIGDGSGRPPDSSPASIAPENFHIGRPGIMPVLEFLVFQTVISFVWHRVNLWISGASASARIVAALLSTVLSAYLTCWNASNFARFQIESEGRHYIIFESFWLTRFALSMILMTVLSVERCSRSDRASGIALGLARTVLPMAVVFFASCIFFDEAFEDRLQPVWAAITHHQPLK